MVESTEVEKQKSSHDPHPLGECRPWLFALTEVLFFLFLLFFFLLFLPVDIQNRFNRPFSNQQFFFFFSYLTVLSIILFLLDCQLMKFLIQRLTGWELCNLQFVKGLLRRFMNCDFLTVFLKELFAVSSLAVLDIDLPCVAIIFDVLLQRLNLNHSFLCGLDRIRKRIEPGRQIFNMSGQIVVVAQTFFD